jgi:hypothetical protein
MEMFHIQQTDTLRVYFPVPQANVTDIRVGQPIDIAFADQGGKNSAGESCDNFRINRTEFPDAAGRASSRQLGQSDSTGPLPPLQLRL